MRHWNKPCYKSGMHSESGFCNKKVILLSIHGTKHTSNDSFSKTLNQHHT
jgi:hypothetical protein